MRRGKLKKPSNGKAEEVAADSDGSAEMAQTKKRSKKAPKKSVKKRKSESDPDSSSETEKMSGDMDETVEATSKKRGRKVAKKSKTESDPETNSDADNTETAEVSSKKRGRKAAKKSKVESDPESDAEDTAQSDSDKKGKKRSKPTIKSKSEDAKTESDSDDEDETEYEVEKILELHTKKNGDREFLVRWKGFGKSDDTWEPEKNLSCQELIDAFMKKVEKDLSNQEGKKTDRSTRSSRSRKSLPIRRESSSKEEGSSKKSISQPKLDTHRTKTETPTWRQTTMMQKKQIRKRAAPAKSIPDVSKKMKMEQNTDEEKPYDQFGMLVASELRQLPPRYAILLQKEIQNSIIQHKLSVLDEIPASTVKPENEKVLSPTCLSPSFDAPTSDDEPSMPPQIPSKEAIVQKDIQNCPIQSELSTPVSNVQTVSDNVSPSSECPPKDNEPSEQISEGQKEVENCVIPPELPTSDEVSASNGQNTKEIASPSSPSISNTVDSPPKNDGKTEITEGQKDIQSESSTSGELSATDGKVAKEMVTAPSLSQSVELQPKNFETTELRQISESQKEIQSCVIQSEYTSNKESASIEQEAREIVSPSLSQCDELPPKNNGTSELQTSEDQATVRQKELQNCVSPSGPSTLNGLPVSPRADSPSRDETSELSTLDESSFFNIEQAEETFPTQYLPCLDLPQLL